ncbi:germination protein, Ger(X)C family [Desulfosporosinus acidiphilus SJ4]|uniref:Germination protein, Ger(X)C family n=1 Tax=Desulfosporosinus acidiphilus (strain DSM 22704 / JCM 16185 / SJ4) TaxID=646529 RepID=I4D7L4_DESAJ|nr:Ger(x)C family spore germination protein [Desulfosporosinus acidiphilus]AFM41788.1 germination protein, Ger(X)C family [Desulfosporosinus acidiphilus SJ4]
MKRFIIFLFCGFILLLLSGCWSKRELEKLAIVNVAGYDKEIIDGRVEYRITDLVLKPQRNKGASGKSGSGEGDLLLTGTGDTLQETSREATLRTPRQPFFGQMEAVIVGESLARDGLNQVIELLGRYPEARLRNYILVAKGTAYDVLKSKPEMDESLSREIIDFADSSNVKLGVSSSCDLNELFQDLLAEDRAVTTGVIKKSVSPTTHEDRISIIGMAAFRKDKLAGYLNVNETIGSLLLWNKFRNCRTPIAIVRSDQEKYTYLLRTDQCKIVPEIQGDSMHVKIILKTMGSVVDVSGIQVSSKSIPDLENEVGEKISAIVKDTIDKAQTLNSDFVGFGYFLHRQNPEIWHLWKDKWDRKFPDITYDVSVTAKIINVGDLNQNIQVNH